MLRNPIDYGQNMWEAGKFSKTIGIINRWTDVDFITVYLGAGMMPPKMVSMVTKLVSDVFEDTKEESKPLAIVFVPSIVPDEAVASYPVIKQLVDLKLPVFYSFAGAASAISKVIQHREART
jgi:hypothetical protein